MSYNQPYTNYNDARMVGSRAPPRQEQDARYNGQGMRQNPVGSRPVYQQAPVGYAPSAPHNPAPGLNAPLPLPQPAPTNNLTYGGAHANLQFPPHPDTKPRVAPQNIPVYQQNVYQPRMNIQELVQVPPELASFASDPQFQQILLKVKEQTMINFISLNRSPTAPDSVESISIDAPSRESAQLARGLIETHFKLQAKLKHAETRLQKVQTDLFSAQGEIASGMMIEFHIDPELVGLALGKKGARIKQIEQDTKVTSINVTGETGRIMIVGPDSQSVQRARELLELQEECIPLESHQIEWLSNKFNSGFLHDIKTGSDLIVTRVNSEKFTLDIVGTVQAVRSARFMLSTQLEYVEKQIEIEASERAAREKLQQVRKQYGMSNRYDYENRDRGDRSDRPSNNNRDRNDRTSDRPQGNTARDATKERSSNNVPSTSNRGSRNAGQDSLVTLSTNASQSKKVGSTAQAVAEAVNNAYAKKPAVSNSATVNDAKTSTKGATSASTVNTKQSKNDKKDAAPVPMLQQVLEQKVNNPEARSQKKKRDAEKSTGNPNPATTVTPQQSKKNQGKSEVEAITDGVKNLNVENTEKSGKKNNRRDGNKSEKDESKPVTTDTTPVKTPNNNDKRRNNKTVEPTAVVGRVVEYEEAPLPKRQNNRNKKTMDSLVTVGTAPVTAEVTVSTSESATEGEGESKRRRQQRNKKTKKDETAAATEVSANVSTVDVTPAKETVKDAVVKDAKSAKPSRNAKSNAKEGSEKKADNTEKSPAKADASSPPGLPSPAAATVSTEVVPVAPVSVNGPPAVPVAVVSTETA